MSFWTNIAQLNSFFLFAFPSIRLTRELCKTLWINNKFFYGFFFNTLSIKWHKINDKLQVKATERQTNKSIIIKEDLLCGEHTLNSFIELRRYSNRAEEKKYLKVKKNCFWSINNDLQKQILVHDENLEPSSIKEVSVALISLSFETIFDVYPKHKSWELKYH